MDNTDILQTEVSDVYQKALMSVPESVTSISDTVDNQFINEFIMYFRGSRLDGVTLMDDTNEVCRSKVLELFDDIERDLFRVRNNYTDISTLSSDKHILHMYLDGRKEYDDSVKDAFYNVQNMAGADKEASDILNQVYEKKQGIKAFVNQPNASYDSTTREGIREHFFDNGIIQETTTKKGNTVDVISAEEMQKRPSEVETLMNALLRLVEKANGVGDIDTCLWIGYLAKSGTKIGDELVRDSAPDSPIVHATEACRKVERENTVKYGQLRANVSTDEETSLSSTADPYKKFLFGMIKDGKVSKDGNGPIEIVDVASINPEEISTLCNQVKHALFSLGPKDRTEPNEPVEFDASFDRSIHSLKPYVDFLNNDVLNPVVAKDKTIKSNMTKLIAAYVLTKAVHDTFNGCIMTYSKNEVMMDDRKVPSFASFSKAIDDNCKEFNGADIDRDYIFSYRIMFSTELPYFPIEQIVKQNPNLYNLMVEYRRSCMEADAANVMAVLESRHIPVKYVSGEFAEKFNHIMKGAARLDGNCENLKLATMLTSTQFADAFNTVSDGIAYSFSADVNDRETEYKLWSVLKTITNRTPEALGPDVKKECINASHVQEDLMFRLNLAVKAGVFTKEKGYHFSNNFGTVEGGKNIQATRINQIMKIFYAYVIGLLFKKTDAALATIGYQKKMSKNLVMPYLSKVYDLAKEYNEAFESNNAENLGCSREWSDNIMSVLGKYAIGGKNVS